MKLRYIEQKIRGWLPEQPNKAGILMQKRKIIAVVSVVAVVVAAIVCYEFFVAKPIISPMTTSTVLPLPTPSPTPNVKVDVTGWTECCQSGSIVFKNPSGQYETLISNRWYSIRLTGGQSYNVTITYQGTQGEETQSTTVYIPNYEFNANFPPITAFSLSEDD